MGTNNERSQAQRIETFVFLDFEATGLFPEDPLNPLNAAPVPGDPNRDPHLLLTNYIRTTNTRDAPRITEICLLSVSRKQIEAATDPANLRSSEDETILGLQPEHTVVRLPCNVHTRQVNPHLSETAWADYEKKRNITSALNYTRSQLEEKNSFALEWQGAKLFLEQLPKPVCILAHNGIRFDFRILCAEFERNSLLQSKPIPDDIFFVDSFLMFIDLDKKLHDELRTLTQVVDWGRVNNVHASSKREIATSLSPVAEAIRENPADCAGTSAENTTTEANERQLTVREEIRLLQYETPRKRPPEHRSVSEPARTPKRRLRFEMSEDHPLQFARMSHWSPAKKIRLRPNFFQRTPEGDWRFDNLLAMKYFREKGVYRLEEMYKQLTRRSFDAHFAQDDCDALLQVCLAYGRDFVHYVDTHVAKFPF